MRNSRSMAGTGGSKAIVPSDAKNALIVRNSDLAVIPPRPLPLTLKARRSFTKVTRYAMLAGAFALCGYSYGNPDIRRFVDYRFTLWFSPGISSVANVYRERINGAEPLPMHALTLFSGRGKGPRADKFAYALGTPQSGNFVPKIEASEPKQSEETASSRTAALAGATLFMTTFSRQDESSLPPEFAALPPLKSGGEWAGLLKNASLSPELPKPEQPKALFGGLTEDEFRTRELRCMATAIYFEARDEPVRGQIAVGQVIMNRIRSPYFPKTICGVVYQGERNRHGCQFSFTCTGRWLQVNEREQWAIAVKLAKQVIAAEVWIDEVGYATHYHANYVRPGWHELEKVTQIGRHIFYRMKPGTVQVALLNEGL